MPDKISSESSFASLMVPLTLIGLSISLLILSAFKHVEESID
jgi:hypothetical protein